MKLKVHYDPDCDAIGANYKQPHDGAREVEGLGWVVIDLLDRESHVPVGLEVIGISRWLPLGKRGYCEETDILTFGDGVKTQRWLRKMATWLRTGARTNTIQTRLCCPLRSTYAMLQSI